MGAPCCGLVILSSWRIIVLSRITVVSAGSSFTESYDSIANEVTTPENKPAWGVYAHWLGPEDIRYQQLSTHKDEQFVHFVPPAFTDILNMPLGVDIADLPGI